MAYIRQRDEGAYALSCNQSKIFASDTHKKAPGGEPEALKFCWIYELWLALDPGQPPSGGDGAEPHPCLRVPPAQPTAVV
jgi:hypothetical protein